MLGTFATLLLTAGCAENNISIFVRQVQMPDPESKCFVSAEPTSPTIGSGVMDRHLTNTFHANLLIGNQLIRRADTNSMRSETSRVQFYEAEIEIFDFAGSQLDWYTQPVAGFADPASDGTPGWGLVTVTMVSQRASADPRLDIQALGAAQTVVSRVKVYGVSTGGTEVETGFWDFPIQVCGWTSPDDSGQCLACTPPTSPEDDIVHPCNYGQESFYDCRLRPCCATGTCTNDPTSC